MAASARGAGHAALAVVKHRNTHSDAATVSSAGSGLGSVRSRGFIVALAISALVSHSCGCFTCFNQLFTLR